MALADRDTLALLLGELISARIPTCRCLADVSDIRDLLGDVDELTMRARDAAVTVWARDAAVLRPLAARCIIVINIRRRS